MGLRFFSALVIVMAFLIFPVTTSASPSHIRAVVLPFEAHGEDAARLRRAVMDALSLSLEASGVEIVGVERLRELVLEKGVERFDEEAGSGVAKEVQADFAILGSVTKVGRTVSMDMRVFDPGTQETVSFYFKSSPSEGELLNMVRELGGVLSGKMAARVKERPAVKKGIIDKVTVTGNRRVDTEAIMKKIRTGVGEPFSPEDVKEDIRSIYGMGYFEDVAVDLSETASGKVLTYEVKELPFIRKVEVRGSSEVDEEKIKGAITVKEDTVLNRATLAEDAERVKALYASEGFYLASVTPRVTSDGLEADIVFEIEEGPQVRVKRITIIGNSSLSDRDLKKVMNTREHWLLSFATGSGKFNEFLFENDLALILGEYYDKGFIDADVLDHRVLLSPDRKWFYITIAVTEGEKYTVGSLGFSGELLASEEEFLEMMKVAPGDVFSRSKLSRDLDTMLVYYGDKGYAYAEVKPLTDIKREEKTVDITFDIRKNELVYVERIDIFGNIRTRDKVIRRELELGETELYSSSAIKRSRNNLKRLGYFEDVAIKETRGSEADRIKLDVQVKERPTGSISLGVGYSSVDKLIGTASIAQSNLMGTGIKLDLSGTISASSSLYILGFTQPWLFDRPLSAGLDLYNTEREYPDFDIRKNGFDIRLGFPIIERYTRGFITYTLEDIEVFNVAETASAFIKEQEGENTESSVRLTIRRDTRDDIFFPTEGSVVSLTNEFAGGPLGGNTYFIKNELDAVKFFPLPWNTTFSVRGAIGYLQGYSDREPPIYERYFLGGMNSLRGFETRSISPKDPETGDLIGGNSMMLVNLEFLFPIFAEQNIRGVVFFDAGNSYKGRIDPDDIRTGAGAGIRWFSPIGPLRLELGFNLDTRDDEPSSQWDFTIGTAF